MIAQVEKGYRSGCIGQIATLHAQYYARSHGFGLAFEAKVASELARFCSNYQDERDGLWLALHGNQLLGSIAIDGSHGAQDGAHLRWFITADAARGQGLGQALLQAALDFCAACGYAQTYLWTFQGLDAARHLYEKHGFSLDRQSPGQQWGTVVMEQCFMRRSAGLPAPRR